MEITRLLNCDESEASGHGTDVGVEYTRLPTMAIKRLLNRDDSDTSDHETAMLVDNSSFPPPQLAVVLSPPPGRTVMSTPPPPMTVMPVPPPQMTAAPVPALTTTVTRPRQPRPRKPSAQSLQAKVDALELVVKHLECVLRDLDELAPPSSMSTVAIREDNKSTKITGKTDSQRIRSFLKNTIVLTKEAHKEIAIRTEYLRLLKHQYEGAANVRQLFRGLSLSEWFWMCDRWRAITLEYYLPISAERCYKIVQETLQAIEMYQLPAATNKTSAFGWRDSVQLDEDGNYVRFMIRKTLENVDIKQVVDHKWSLYTDGDLFKKAHLGDSSDFFHQTLQEISPDLLVIQRIEKYANSEEMAHSLALVFRVKTETGYMLVFRSIESPQLQSMMKADGLTLCGTFTWDTFSVAHRDEQGECESVLFTTAGSIGSDNPAYAKRWRDDLVITLVRYEAQLMDSPIVTIEPVSDEEDVTSNNLNTV